MPDASVPLGQYGGAVSAYQQQHAHAYAYVNKGASGNSNTREKQNNRTRKWSKEEDQEMIRLVAEMGIKRWGDIGKCLVGRTGKQCRERWHNQLDPSINKNPWTQAEEELLLRLHDQYGNKWAEIAKLVPGRTDNTIKNHWNSAMRRLQRQSQNGTIPVKKTYPSAVNAYPVGHTQLPQYQYNTTGVHDTSLTDHDDLMGDDEGPFGHVKLPIDALDISISSVLPSPLNFATPGSMGSLGRVAGRGLSAFERSVASRTSLDDSDWVELNAFTNDELEINCSNALLLIQNSPLASVASTDGVFAGFFKENMYMHGASPRSSPRSAAAADERAKAGIPNGQAAGTPKTGKLGKLLAQSANNSAIKEEIDTTSTPASTSQRTTRSGSVHISVPEAQGSSTKQEVQSAEGSMSVRPPNLRRSQTNDAAEMLVLIAASPQASNLAAGAAGFFQEPVSKVDSASKSSSSGSSNNTANNGTGNNKSSSVDEISIKGVGIGHRDRSSSATKAKQTDIKTEENVPATAPARRSSRRGAAVAHVDSTPVPAVNNNTSSASVSLKRGLAPLSINTELANTSSSSYVRMGISSPMDDKVENAALPAEQPESKRLRTSARMSGRTEASPGRTASVEGKHSDELFATISCGGNGV